MPGFPPHPRPSSYSLFWRLGLANAAVITAALAALALSPATVSFPVKAHELVVLCAGVAAIVAINLVVLRRALSPLAALTGQMAAVDLLDPRGTPVPGTDCREIAAITESFNQMVERLQYERRESARREVVVQEAERERMAHELHDDIGQSLTVLMLELMQAAREADGPVAARLAEAQETTRLVLDDVRQLGRRLRPESLDDLGLAQALVTLAGRVSAAAEIEVETAVSDGLSELSPEAELVVLRVAQEGLTNVVKHSGASHVSMRLQAVADGVTFELVDNGRGPAGTIDLPGGVRGMRARALTVGGRLALSSPDGQGLAVRLWLPHTATTATPGIPA